MREDWLKDPSKPMPESTSDAIKELWDTTRSHLADSLPRIAWDNVVDALVSNRAYSYKFIKKGLKIAEKKSNSVYLNSLSESTANFIPVVSMLQLANFSDGRRSPLEIAVNEFAEKEWMASVRGETFEEFMVYWERVFHECRRLHAQSGKGNWKMSLADYYSDNEFAYARFVKYTGRTADIIVSNNSKTCETSTFTSQGFLDELVHAVTKDCPISWKLTDFLESKSIVQCKNNQPGFAFDYVQCFEGEDMGGAPTKVFVHSQSPNIRPLLRSDYSLSGEFNAERDLMKQMRFLESQYRKGNITHRCLYYSETLY